MDKHHKEAIKELKEEAGIKEEEKKQLSTYIFDENEILKKRVFTSHWTDKDIFAFGLLLPKMEDIQGKKGEKLGENQVWKPVIITSDYKGLSVSKWLETSLKISYEEIPQEMKLRWKLKDIRDYLDNSPVVEGIELFNEIKKEYEYYLYFREKNWYSIHALWDIGTYLHQSFSAYPIFEKRGLSGTAKSKGMLVSSFISLNGTDIMINPSESTLFRITEELRPTKYIDEAEKLFKFTKEGMEADNRVELINASYTRNGVVPRQEKIGNRFITKWYHVYSPTMISSINGLYGATENRAITQIMTKSPDDDIRGERDPENDINDIKWENIRNKCYVWALNNCKKIKEEYLNFCIESKLKKRDLQIWKPLLVIAKVIDEKKLLPEIIAFAEKVSEQRKNDSLSESTLDYKFLLCLSNLINKANSSKIYLEAIRQEHKNIYGFENEPKSNKSISAHLDKLGFKDLRDKDMYGAFYDIDRKSFDEIITPITKDFLIKESKEKSSCSSDSSYIKEKQKKIDDESMMNKMNNSNNLINNNDEYDEKDEYDDDSNKKPIFNEAKIKSYQKEQVKKLGGSLKDDLDFSDLGIKEILEGEKNE
ncbi:MAG: hypothetical protein WC979_05385 [Candidatus Pacearchaeota archaeon]|jgi:hypothetical protein